LCGLLESTGVAGRPESYFRAPDEATWAARFGIVKPSGAYDYADFVRGALAAGRSANGVFASRVMWGTLTEMLEKVTPAFGEPSGSDLDVLRRAFGPIRFVYLERHDVVAQAVSWSRAEQTDIWFEPTTAGHEPSEHQPHFDRARIDELCATIIEHNAAWQQWFAAVGVEPYRVTYEGLDQDPAGTTQAVLDYLGIELPPSRSIQVRHRRLADELNTQWIKRYRATS
jgi:LPS sulfotransferase NodH